jgi:hypothetical protein
VGSSPVAPALVVPVTKPQTTTGSRAGCSPRSGFNVEATIAYLIEHGGTCDCEVLLNVDAGLRAERKKL